MSLPEREARPLVSLAGPWQPLPLAFVLVFALVAANAIFNTLSTALGAPPHAGSFLFDPNDRFADFFKVILSYPGGDDIARRPMLAFGDHIRTDLMQGYDRRSPILLLSDPHPRITPFHLTPLSTLSSLMALRAMRVVDPALLFGTLCLALLLYLLAIVRGAVARPTDARWAMATALLSYPLLLVWTRGNLFAGAAALLILHALLLALRRRAPVLAASLLAVAINIRPNAIGFALVLVALMWPWRWRVALVGAVATTAIGAASLVAAHALYPAYDGETFGAGLRLYDRLYVVGDLGIPYGSSLLGALKMLLGHPPHLVLLAAMPSAIILGSGLWLFAHGRFSRSALLFLACAAYTLGSAVFADYHLLIFLIVPFSQAIDRETISLRRSLAGAEAIAATIAVASAAMLAPKNYLFSDGASLQVILNPALLLIACAVVFTQRRLA